MCNIPPAQRMTTPGAGSAGFVMGFWTANSSVGNILGTIIGATVAAQGGSWELSVAICAGLIMLGGILIFLFLVPSPVDVGLPDPNRPTALEADGGGGDSEGSDAGTAAADAHEPLLSMADGDGDGDAADACKTDSGDGSDGDSDLGDSSSKPAVGFLQAWLIPGVIPYAFAYANLKSVNYAMLFWLPLYLQDAFKMTAAEADWASILYDAGGIVGSATAGLVSDRIGGVRSPVTVTMMVLSAVAVCAMEPTWMYSGAAGPSLTAVRALLFVSARAVIRSP